jgi:multidrug efflux pump subunit AcrA (membrane-fusion protein)
MKTKGQSAHKKSGRVYRVLNAALFCFVAAGCGTTEKEKEPVVPVQISTIGKSFIAETISADAVVFPLQQAVVIPKITSTIKKFYVQRGAKVHKGQLLATLENADLAAAAEQSKGELEQAKAGYATTTESGLPQQIQKAELDAAAAQAAFDAQQKVYDSRKQLFDQGALPRRDLDSARVALLQTKSQNDVAQRQLADLKRLGEREALRSASGQLAAAQGKYQSAAAQLSYSEIRSPMDGVVTDRPQYEGELATANQPLLTVMDISKLIAKAHIGQAEANRIKRGDEVEISVPGNEEPNKGRVTLVSPALDPGSTTVEVWAEALKPSPSLKPGITVQLSIIAGSAKDALVVPTPAVFKLDEGADYVVLAGSDSKAHVANVKVGLSNAEFTQILEGVKEGDSVITSGGYALPDKTQIKVQPHADKADGTKTGAAPNAETDKD